MWSHVEGGPRVGREGLIRMWLECERCRGNVWGRLVGALTELNRQLLDFVHHNNQSAIPTFFAAGRTCAGCSRQDPQSKTALIHSIE
jgi:hypothetical protein